MRFFKGGGVWKKVKSKSWNATPETHRQGVAREAHERNATLDLVAHHLADVLAGDNASFDRDRFLRACVGAE